MDVERGVSSRHRGGGGSVGLMSNEVLNRGETPKLMLVYLRRLLHISQMDFQHAFTQMAYLMVSPSKVYKLASWRYQTKNQWASDDPAFFVLLIVLLCFASVAYGIALGTAGFTGILRLICISLAMFSISGVVIASIGWWISNTYLVVHHAHSVNQKVEWMYALDIHNNAFFAMFVVLYVVQFLLLPILLGDSYFASLLANVLYSFAFSYYHFVSFLGYMHLPFLASSQVTTLLYPIAVIVVFHAVLSLLNINSSKVWLSLFFD